MRYFHGISRGFRSFPGRRKCAQAPRRAEQTFAKNIRTPPPMLRDSPPRRLRGKETPPAPPQSGGRLRKQKSRDTPSAPPHPKPGRVGNAAGYLATNNPQCFQKSTQQSDAVRGQKKRRIKMRRNAFSKRARQRARRVRARPSSLREGVRKAFPGEPLPPSRF